MLKVLTLINLNLSARELSKDCRKIPILMINI